MNKFTFVLFAVISVSTAQDITLSKDTYLVRPPSGGGTTYTYDTVTIKNSGPEAVTLDSILIEVEDLDTTRYMGDPPYLKMNELFGGGQRGINFRDLDSLGDNVYRCIIDPTLVTSVNYLAIGASGDSIRLTSMMIGSCINCAAIYALPFSHAVLRLYYSNGETVELRLYSDDLREPVEMVKSQFLQYRAPAPEGNSIYLVNGRRTGERQNQPIRSGVGNLMVIHDGKKVRPVLSGVRSSHGR